MEKLFTHVQTFLCFYNKQNVFFFIYENGTFERTKTI